uniref:Uncharacterized protein n=1 Tax=Ditylenchus dipsaci TaxID=166011 RepID=A0A915CYW4_9BILA
MISVCTFGGQLLDCCDYAEPVSTFLGQCYKLNLTGAGEYLIGRQMQDGINHGLQLVLNSNIDQQFQLPMDIGPPLTSKFETGFRLYAHESKSFTFAGSDWMSVAPGHQVQSSLKASELELLPYDDWGNCSNEWPSDYIQEDYGFELRTYSFSSCQNLCFAKFFKATCSCVPLIYHLKAALESNICSPYQAYKCIREIQRNVTRTEPVRHILPPCYECRLQCNSVVYKSQHNYGGVFSETSLKWLHKMNKSWTEQYVNIKRANHNDHWNQTTAGLAVNALKKLMGINSSLFTDLLLNYRQVHVKKQFEEKQRNDLWKLLDLLALSPRCDRSSHAIEVDIISSTPNNKLVVQGSPTILQGI